MEIGEQESKWEVIKFVPHMKNSLLISRCTYLPKISTENAKANNVDADQNFP